MDQQACGDTAPTTVTPIPFQPARSIWVTRAGDGPAQDLAERLVALRRTGADTVVRVMALSPELFRQEIRAGRSAGYVLAVPRLALDPCRATQDLLQTAPWLSGGVIVPLIDTRRRVVVRRGASALTVDWDGTLRLR